jgi:UDP-N-acetylmuramoylalanine-D-glutamate ligase
MTRKIHFNKCIKQTIFLNSSIQKGELNKLLTPIKWQIETLSVGHLDWLGRFTNFFSTKEKVHIYQVDIFTVTNCDQYSSNKIRKTQNEHRIILCQNLMDL